MTKRALFMAGGGLKVAYQAGVLQVWLDECGLVFDHADGVSAGAFNLAMWTQGLSGTQIADNWRAFHPLRGLSIAFGQLARPWSTRSILTYRRFRRNVLPTWGLDWTRIRTSGRSASFNLFDVTAQRLIVVDAPQMTEDHLMAAVSLPTWFPPILIDGLPFVDAVHVTGANLEHAIALGCDELWIVWTVSTTGRTSGGFVNLYFQIFEECANSHLSAMLATIETNNEAVRAGRPGQFGRVIEVKIIRAEVPLHYLLNFRSSRFPAAVDMGVRDARRWSREQGLLA